MKKEKPKKYKQVIKTIERAIDFGYNVSEVKLALGSAWGLWQPGRSVHYFGSKAKMLLACDKDFKRGVLAK